MPQGIGYGPANPYNPYYSKARGSQGYGYGPNDPLNPYYSIDNFREYLRSLTSTGAINPNIGLTEDSTGTETLPSTSNTRETYSNLGFTEDNTGTESVPSTGDTGGGAGNAPPPSVVRDQYWYDNPIGPVMDIFASAGYNTSSLDPIFSQYAAAASALPLVFDIFFAGDDATKQEFTNWVNQLYNSGAAWGGTRSIADMISGLLSGDSMSTTLTELINQDPTYVAGLLGDLMRAFSPGMTNAQQRAMGASLNDLANMMIHTYDPEMNRQTAFMEALRQFAREWFGL